MAEYKLVYLNYRGRAELIRFILAYTGVKYEDSRLAPEKWPEARPGTPLGLLPYLEIGDKTITGNAAIARYFAEKHGLAGSNELENAELAGLVEVCEDLWTRIHSIYWLKDETAKEEAKKVLKESYLPLTLMKLEQKMKDNTCGSGWIYGSKVTYADFAVYVLIECILPDAPNLLDHFPHLSKLMETVEGLDKIKEWIQTRPETPH